MDSGGDVNYPQPTTEERALTAEQTQLLRDQRTQMQEQLRLQNLLAPVLYRNAGLQPIYSSQTDMDPRLGAQITDLEAQMQAVRDRYTSQLSALPPDDWLVPGGGPGGTHVTGGQLRQQIMAQMEGELAPLQAQLDPLARQRTAFQSGSQIVGFQDLPETPEEMRQRRMEELSFERATSAFEMEKARFAQEQADLPNLQKQRELENKFRERSLADLEEQAAARGANAEVEGLIRQRTLAALKGELPVNPALLRELSEGEENLRSQLMKQLGTGFETSTPGIEALANFSQRKSEILEAARRGDLQMGEQLNFAREASRSQRLTEALPVLASRLSPNGANFDSINQAYAGMSAGAGLRQQQLMNTLLPMQAGMPIIGGFGNVAQGFNSPISALQNQRQGQFSASMQNAQADAAQSQGYGALFGTALMAAATYA